MPYDGHCMCGRIQVSLQQQPSHLGSSINYVLGDSDVTIKDSRLSLKSYGDYHTQSGNIVLRQFCSECGRQVFACSPISTKSPDFPGKTLLKASLFDEISRPSQEVFTSRRQTWEPAIEGAKQD
ncbi:hypothetical protein BO86DRAFT_316778 [Aspergillus japonicus CBS 114.51]|uniref:CENP-V/GFA domain-containing protein n=1 Tax=Aspergillus japonicus CBS 114.51 TaxID=1448312 RepID=A0A8T8WWB7_ASPJA|nr:hypothetical protein BO86DRAFT_316778 [Aspergillus japonicus CBS 114.51]RAH80147.1 hypothetical protein BO86DRAFT_316778 [Aspergillus japonicus CBS 114.51]